MTSRTTPQQIELMVAFMEKHGDLNRAHQTKDRLQLRKLWAALVARLGALTEPGGRAKSLDKWKKTWSDIKNNVKRKATRIAHPELRPPSLLPPARAAPPLRLSRLDVRVLVLMGLIQRTSSSLRKAAAAAASRVPSPPLPQAELDAPGDAQVLQELGGADPLTGIKAEEVEFEVERAGDEEFVWPEAPAPAPGEGEALQEDVELVEEEAGVQEPEGEEEPEPVEAVVRPDRCGHTSTRSAGGAGGARRGGVVRRALAALLRAEARRARGEARGARLQRRWQTLCTKGLALLERLAGADRSERDDGGGGGGGGGEGAGARGCGEEWEEEPLRPCVLHPDRQRL